MPPVRTSSKRTGAFYGEWTLAILEILAAHGALALAVLLGSRRAVTRGPKILAGISVQVIRNTLRRLAKLELITMAEHNGEVMVMIAERGRRRLLRARFDDLTLERPRRWDGRWRVVVFDIPEKHRLARNLVRNKLRSLEFVPIQRSVFVTPYPCRDALDLIAEVFEARPYLQCFEATSLGNIERTLKQHFRLR